MAGYERLKIRKERPSDIRFIRQLTTDAFANLSISDGSEPAIIDDLRRAGDLALSLVVVQDDNLVGHVAFSPVIVGESAEKWFGLGPVSVLPQRQREGIGTALINEGLQRLRVEGAAGCVLVGDPAYYHRFGFVSDGTIHYGDVPDECVQWLSFGDSRPKGMLQYSSAFQG